MATAASASGTYTVRGATSGIEDRKGDGKNDRRPHFHPYAQSEAETLLSAIETSMSTGQIPMTQCLMPISSNLPPAKARFKDDSGLNILVGDATNLDLAISRAFKSCMLSVPLLNRSGVMSSVRILSTHIPYGSVYCYRPMTPHGENIMLGGTFEPGIKPVNTFTLLALNGYTYVNYLELPYHPSEGSEGDIEKWRNEMEDVYRRGCRDARSMSVGSVVFPVIPSKGSSPKRLLGEIALETLRKEALVGDLDIYLVFSHETSYSDLGRPSAEV